MLQGLGTSTREEAREYFAAIDHHRKQFIWRGDEDGAALEMAFSKKKVDERKDWLSSFVPGTFLDNSASRISYTDFINKASVACEHSRRVVTVCQRTTVGHKCVAAVHSRLVSSSLHSLLADL